MQDNPNHRFVDLKQAFCRYYMIMQNDEQVYLQLKNLKLESTERIKVYYAIILKLVNSLQIFTIHDFLAIELWSTL